MLVARAAGDALRGDGSGSEPTAQVDVSTFTATASTNPTPAQPTAPVISSTPDSAVSATAAGNAPSGADTDSAAANSSAPGKAAAVGAAADSAVAGSAAVPFQDMPGYKARRLVVVPADDDCMFAAVATAAGIHNAQLLRVAAVAFLRCNAERVLPNAFSLTLAAWLHAVQAVSFHTAVQGFQSGGEPGTCMLAVLATILGRPITMFGRSVGVLTCLPEGATPASEWISDGINPGHLAILFNGTHYDALVLDDAVAFDEATLTFASMIHYLPKDDANLLVGTYSLRSSGTAPTTLLVRLFVHVTDSCN